MKIAAGIMKPFQQMDLSAGGDSSGMRANQVPETGFAANRPTTSEKMAFTRPKLQTSEPTVRRTGPVTGSRSESALGQTAAAEKEPVDLPKEKARYLISDEDAARIFESCKFSYF